MGYGTYLKDLLRPLGLYDLTIGPGVGELETLGMALDEVYDRLTEIEREIIPSTAENWGLEMYENILPYHPASSTLKKRRQAVMALLRIDDASFTPQAIQNTVAGCGIPAIVTEGEAHQTVQVSFPGVRGAPDRFEELKERIELILPCHLGVEYVLVYLTWEELEAMEWTWETIENKQLTWDGLERYSEEEAS